MDHKDTLNQSLRNVFGFHFENGLIEKTEMELPQYVKDRIEFFQKYIGDGLTFLGALKFVLSENEEECQKDFAFGAYEEWLPVTEEFKEWRDSYWRKADMEVAVALIYGFGTKRGK